MEIATNEAAAAAKAIHPKGCLSQYTYRFRPGQKSLNRIWFRFGMIFDFRTRHHFTLQLTTTGFFARALVGFGNSLGSIYGRAFRPRKARFQCNGWHGGQYLTQSQPSQSGKLRRLPCPMGTHDADDDGRTALSRHFTAATRRRFIMPDTRSNLCFGNSTDGRAASQKSSPYVKGAGGLSAGYEN